MEASGKYLDNLRVVVSASRDALGGLGHRNSGAPGVPLFKYNYFMIFEQVIHAHRIKGGPSVTLGLCFTEGGCMAKPGGPWETGTGGLCSLRLTRT